MEAGTRARGSRRVVAVLALAFVALWLAQPAPAAQKPASRSAHGHVHPLIYGSGEGANPYLVYIPASYNRSKAAPMVVMAHGCQTTARQQMRANLYNRLADRKGFIVVYPDVNAQEVAQPGPLARCWQFFNSESWHRGSGDAADIAGITRAVIKRWHVARQRVYLMGMSAGSFMTSIMAAAYPDLYAAVGIMAGGAYADPTCLFTGPGIPAATSAQMAYDEMGSRARVVPRLVMGGDSDQGVPPACASKALEQGLRTNNLVLGDSQTSPISLDPTGTREVLTLGGYGSTVSTYRDPNGCLIGRRWLIHGMNHFWSGGSANPKWANFTDPKGPNGAQASWRFFRRFTKKSTAMPCVEQ